MLQTTFCIIEYVTDNIMLFYPAHITCIGIIYHWCYICYNWTCWSLELVLQL